MRVEKAVYELDQGRPILRLVIDGQPAIVPEVKWSLLELGYVALASPAGAPADYWANVLPAVQLPANIKLGRGDITLRGVTNDPVVVQLVRDFCRAVNEEDGQEYQPREIDLAKRLGYRDM